MEVKQFEMFKGTGAHGVVLLAVLEEPDENGFLEVAERWKDAEGNVSDSRYVKPLSELESELGEVVTRTGRTSTEEKINENMDY